MNTHLNILVLTKRQYTNKDLIDDHYGRIREIPLCLARRGHRVSGICLSYRKRQEGIHTDDGVCWESVNTGVSLVPGLARFARKTFQSLKTCDVLWACSDSLFGVIGYILSRRLNKPLVFDLYDNFECFLLGRLPLFRALYRWVVRNCHAVTVASLPLRDLVRSYGRTKGVFVLENAVAPDVFHPLDKQACRSELKLPSTALLIGTAGALFRNRGIEVLFQSFHLLASKYGNLHLAVAGPRDVRIPAHPRIHDMGILEYQKIPKLFNALDIGIICNQAGAFGSYCFPQKAREMMASGLPIVAADVGSMKILFANHWNWLFQPESAGHLAETIENRMRDRGTDYGHTPTWSDAAGEIESIFMQVARDH